MNPATNKAEISPLFDGELAYIESRKAAGSLWVPTMVQLGDYLTLLPNVSVVNNLDGTYTVTNNNATSVDAVTLLAESAVQSATFEGVPLASFGGDLGSNEIVLPSLNPGQSATLEVNLAPSVTTSTASPGTTTATIFGMLTHLGSTGGANVSFEWGETTSYGNTTSALTLTRAGEFSAILFGLAPGVTYHFKAKANGGVSGAAYGEDAAFTTYGDSFSRFEYYHAHTNGTSAGYHAAQILTPWVTHTIKSAKLMLANAGASSGNLTVSIRATDEEGAPFGPDLIAAPPIEESSIGAGYSVYNFDLGDGYLLQAGTKYAISLKADMPGIFIMLDTSATYAGGWYSSSNNGLDGFGNWNEHNRIWDIWFEEWGNAYFSGGPSVITASADQVTSSGARLNGFVESLGSAVSANVSFRYAPSTIADLDQGTRLNGTPYSLSAPDTFGAVLAGLEPDTAYHFRAVAEATGVIIAYGSDVTFVTAPATSAPSVTTNAPSGVTTTAALFNGNLAGLGTAPTVRASFEWGTASGVYSNSTSPRTMASTGPFSQAVSGLSPATTYFFRARADGGVAGIDFGDEMTFSTSTPPTPPSVMTSPASGITQTSASLNGNITSLGTAPSASVSFEYGKTTAYGNTIPGSPQQLSATGAFIANLAGLETSTLYHFRAKALGATGTAYGGDMTFTTAAIAPPVAATSAASNILPTSATLGGVITSAGSATHVEVSFEYGPTGAYGSTVSGTPSNPSVSGTFGANLTGLAPDTLYHYRAKADGGDAGTGYGNDAVFVTPPSVTTGEVAEVSPFSALLSGNVGQLGAGRSANVSFEWGPAPGSYNAETAPRLNSEGAFSDYVTGLSPNTTYYYRAKAVGSATGFGAERSFATLSVTSPTVRTLDPLTVGYTSATLTASLISLGTAPAVDVFFEWGTDSGNLSNRTAARSLTAPVSLNATISGLSPGTTYYFQAKADGGPIHGLALGGVKSFTALSTPSGTGGGGVGGGGGGGGGSLGGTTVTLAGFTTTTLQLDSSGAVPQDVRLSSGDGTVIVELSAGAKLIEATGETLKSMAWSGAAVLTGVPPDRVVISAWSLGPNGARFDPGITLTAKFDPQILPSRIEASGLYLAYWTDDAWNGLTSTVDAHAGTVTAEVTHFTLFALMGKSPAPAAAPPTTAAPAATPARFIVSDLAISPQRIQPGQEVSITVKVTNFGGTRGDYELTPTINGDRREGKVLTLDPGVSETIRFSVTESVSGAYEVAVNGLNGSFIVENPSQGVPPTPPTSPPQETPGSNPADASAGESSVQASIGGTASTGLNWPAVVGGAAGILIAIGVTFWFVKRERSSNA